MLPATKVKLREVCGKVCLSVAVTSWNLLLSICRALRFVVIWYLLDTVNDLQRITAASPPCLNVAHISLLANFNSEHVLLFLDCFSLCIPSLS